MMVYSPDNGNLWPLHGNFHCYLHFFPCYIPKITLTKFSYTKDLEKRCLVQIISNTEATQLYKRHILKKKIDKGHQKYENPIACTQALLITLKCQLLPS